MWSGRIGKRGIGNLGNLEMEGRDGEWGCREANGWGMEVVWMGSRERRCCEENVGWRRKGMVAEKCRVAEERYSCGENVEWR